MRDVPRRVPPAQRARRRRAGRPGDGDRPRDGAHVVRRPGDHEVVAGHLAQRVVRRLHGLPRGPRGRRPRLVARLLAQPQADRLRRRRTPLDPPDRRGRRAPGRRRHRVHQLRHDHLRQGRVGAAPAGDLAGLGHLRQGHERLPDPAPVRQRRAGRLPRGARLGHRPRRARLGRGLPAHHRLRHDPGDPRRRRTGAGARGLAAPPVQRRRPRGVARRARRGWSTSTTTSRWRCPSFAGAGGDPQRRGRGVRRGPPRRPLLAGRRRRPVGAARPAAAGRHLDQRLDPGPHRPGAARRLPDHRAAPPRRRDRPGRLRQRAAAAVARSASAVDLARDTTPRPSGSSPRRARPRWRPATPTAAWPRCAAWRGPVPTSTCCGAGSTPARRVPGLEVDRDTRWLAVRRLVVLGAAGADLVATEAAADRSSSGHQSSLAALASRPDPAAKAEAWERIVDPPCPTATSRRSWPGCGPPGQAGPGRAVRRPLPRGRPPDRRARPGLRPGGRLRRAADADGARPAAAAARRPRRRLRADRQHRPAPRLARHRRRLRRRAAGTAGLDRASVGRACRDLGHRPGAPSPDFDCARREPSFLGLGCSLTRDRRTSW